MSNSSAREGGTVSTQLFLVQLIGFNCGPCDQRQSGWLVNDLIHNNKKQFEE